MLPPKGVGVDGKADVVTVVKLVENIERLAKAGDHRTKAAHHRVKGLKSKPDPVVGGKLCCRTKPVNKQAAGMFDAAAITSGRQIFKSAGDHYQGSGTEHVGEIEPVTKRCLALEETGDTERFRHHVTVVPDPSGLGDAA